MTRAERNSHLTAISRKHLSAPMRYLMTWGHVRFGDNKRILDYGCGRGQDAKRLHIDRYDPHYFPELPLERPDIIVCSYVLNVLPKAREQVVLNEIRSLLKPYGVAYITVRRNIKKPGYTSRGTYQRNVRLNLPVVTENADFCIYRLDNPPPI